METSIFQTPATPGLTDLDANEIDAVGGGIAWFIIPMVAIATHLASEYYHHHA